MNSSQIKQFKLLKEKFPIVWRVQVIPQNDELDIYYEGCYSTYEKAMKNLPNNFKYNHEFCCDCEYRIKPVPTKNLPFRVLKNLDK